MKCLRNHPHLVYILTNHDKPRSIKSMSQWFSAESADAGLANLSANSLRKYLMNQIAEAAVPLVVMQSWVGHTSLKEVERYTRRASRRNGFFVNHSEILQK